MFSILLGSLKYFVYPFPISILTISNTDRYCNNSAIYFQCIHSTHSMIYMYPDFRYWSRFHVCHWFTICNITLISVVSNVMNLSYLVSANGYWSDCWEVPLYTWLTPGNWLLMLATICIAIIHYPNFSQNMAITTSCLNGCIYQSDICPGF